MDYNHEGIIDKRKFYNWYTKKYNFIEKKKKPTTIIYNNGNPIGPSTEVNTFLKEMSTISKRADLVSELKFPSPEKKSYLQSELPLQSQLQLQYESPLSSPLKSQTTTINNSISNVNYNNSNDSKVIEFQPTSALNEANEFLEDLLHDITNVIKKCDLNSYKEEITSQKVNKIDSITDEHQNILNFLLGIDQDVEIIDISENNNSNNSNNSNNNKSNNLDQSNILEQSMFQRNTTIKNTNNVNNTNYHQNENNNENDKNDKKLDIMNDLNIDPSLKELIKQDESGELPKLVNELNELKQSIQSLQLANPLSPKEKSPLIDKTIVISTTSPISTNPVKVVDEKSPKNFIEKNDEKNIDNYIVKSEKDKEIDMIIENNKNKNKEKENVNVKENEKMLLSVLSEPNYMEQIKEEFKDLYEKDAENPYKRNYFKDFYLEKDFQLNIKINNNNNKKNQYNEVDNIDNNNDDKTDNNVELFSDYIELLTPEIDRFFKLGRLLAHTEGITASLTPNENNNYSNGNNHINQKNEEKLFRMIEENEENDDPHSTYYYLGNVSAQTTRNFSYKSKKDSNKYRNR